jgi:hypothetical protein
MMSEEQVWGDDNPKPEVTVDMETADPRYPTTEHLVTVYCDAIGFNEVGKRLMEAGCKIIDFKNNVLSHRYMVRGIPNIIAFTKGVTIIAWRTAEEHKVLLTSFENRRRERKTS